MATGVLTAGLLAAPLPFGSVVPMASAILCALGFVSLAVAAFAVRRSRTQRPDAALPPASGLPWVPVLALAGLALVALLQSATWPVGLVEVVSPEHARLWREARSVLPVTAHPAPSPSLSLAPPVSRRLAWWLASLAATLLSAAIVGRSRILRRALVLAVVAAALFEVLYGVRRWLVRATTIWGLEVPGIAGRLRGTFVNPNHLATYLTLALALLVAWGWWAIRRARRERSPEQRLLWVAPPVVLGLVTLTGLGFTASRGGGAAAVAGLSVMAGLCWLAGSPELRTGGGKGASGFPWPLLWRRVLPSLGLGLAALGVVAWIGFDQAYGRWQETSLYEVTWGARTRVYAATLELWSDFPWLGTGLGSYREAFPGVQPAEVPGTWVHAHSDVLELLATGGAVAALLALVGLASLALRCLRGVLRGLHTEDRATALAGAGILVSMFVHGALDYGLTMPANAFSAAVLVGAAASVRLRPPDSDSITKSR